MMASDEMESLKPIEGAARPDRRRLGWKDELLLATLPTATVLIVLGFVEVLTQQRLLFASLASSAFLIYLDPRHGTNSVRTLVMSQVGAAGVGLGAYLLFDSGYVSGGTAMIAAIVLMVLTDSVHPPAVSTSLAFAFRAGDTDNFFLFGMAVGVTALLVVLERAALWLLARRTQARPSRDR